MTNRIAMSLAALALALAAAPAAANWQSGRAYSSEARLEQDFRQLSWQFERALRFGALDRREADRIGRRLAEIDRLGSRYGRDGHFNRGERQRLERLIREARFELHQSARAPRDRRWQDAGWTYRR